MFEDIDVTMASNPTISDLCSILNNYSDIGKTHETDALNNKWLEINEKLYGTLNKEQRELFGELLLLGDDETYILTQQSFIAGFKIATLLLTEAKNAPKPRYNAL